MTMLREIDPEGVSTNKKDLLKDIYSKLHIKSRTNMHS